jgi:hypothetical protein
VSKARLVITAVVLEGRGESEVAHDFDVSRIWVQHLVRRYEAEGNAAFAPRTRRPHHNPRAVPIDRSKTRSCGSARPLTTMVSTPGPKPSAPTWPPTTRW